MRQFITALAAVSTVLFSLPADAQTILGTPIINFDKVTSRLYRGAVPDKAALKYLSDQGFRTIVDLRVMGSRHEADQCKVLGMTYIHLPLTIFMFPSRSTVKHFFDIMADKQSGKIYLHCLAGGDRTGILVAVYRMRVEHWSFPEAYAEMKDHNFRPWLTTFIETAKEANTRYSNLNKNV